MTTRWKKGLSLLLTVVMLMSMLPTTALAVSVVITLSGGDLSTGDTVTVSAEGYTTTAQVQYSYLRGYHVFADIPSAINKTVTVETADGYSGSAPALLYPGQGARGPVQNQTVNGSYGCLLFPNFIDFLFQPVHVLFIGNRCSNIG